MRPYEVMVIFDAGTEPPAIQASIDRVLETVQTTGGTPGTVDRWGRRPFAYEVKHRREGYYVLIDFSGEVVTVNDLDRMLTLNDEVLRHRVIRLPEQAVGRARKRAPPPGPPPAPRPRRAPPGSRRSRRGRGEEPGARGHRGERRGRGGSATVPPEEAVTDEVPEPVADAAGAEEAGDAGPRGRTDPATSRRGDEMPDNTVTLVGNVTRDPELRFTNTGQPTASFGLAVNRRWQNRQTQEWEEADELLRRGLLARDGREREREPGEGARVVVAGRLEQRSWETAEGDRRSKVEVVADEVGPSLRWATAQITKNERRGPGRRAARRGRPAGAAPPRGAAPPGYGFDEEPF